MNEHVHQALRDLLNRQFEALYPVEPSRPLSCGYCDGSGEIEMDNNGPIVKCPFCEQKDRLAELQSNLNMKEPGL